MPATALALIALVGAPAVLALPLQPLSDLAPGNVIENPGFESVLASWGVRHNLPVLAMPGANGSGQAVSFPDRDWCSYIYQRVDDAVSTGEFLVIEFAARVDGNLEAAAGQRVILYDELVTGSEVTASFDFFRGDLSFTAWDGSTRAPVPSGGGWHTYTAVLVRPLAQATLLIDGIPAAVTLGSPGAPDEIAPADTLLLGDIPCNSSPTASVSYDDFYVGPQL